MHLEANTKSNDSQIASYFRSFGYEVENINDKCYVNISGVSVPVVEGDTVWTLGYKYKKLLESQNKYTGGSRTLTYWPQTFINRTKEYIAQKEIEKTESQIRSRKLEEYGELVRIDYKKYLGSIGITLEQAESGEPQFTDSKITEFQNTLSANHHSINGEGMTYRGILSSIRDSIYSSMKWENALSLAELVEQNLHLS